MKAYSSALQYYINKLFHFIGILFFAIIIIYTVKNLPNPRKILIPAVLTVFILLFLFINFKTVVDNLTNKQMYFILLLSVILMFLAMSYSAYIMLSNPLNDLGTVYYSAKEVLEAGHISRELNEYTACGWSTHTSNNDYFVIYPNNQFILFLLICYYKLLSLAGISMAADLGNFMGCILNVFMISLSIVFGFFLCKKIWANSGALMFLIFSFFFLPYYINAYRFYSDTLSMPFVTSSIFFFFKLKEATSTRQKMIYSLLTAFALAFGILLKGSLYILLAAVIIYSIITIKKKRELMSLGILLITIASINLAWGQYIDRCYWLDNSSKNELELPITHWIMMAATGNGGFRQEDLDFTLSFPSKDEKKAATIEKTMERIQSHKSLDKFLNFELMKISQALCDGKFTQREHLSWYKRKTWIYNYVLEDGLHHKAFYNYITSFIVSVYILIFLSFSLEILSKEIGFGFFINMCIIGMLLFFMLWEVKSRYFLNFTPIYFMCSTNALYNFEALFNYKKRG